MEQPRSPETKVVSRRRGMAAEQLRRHNLSILLELLHLGGAASRSGLTTVTGLNRSTIADLVGELTELGLAEEGPAETPSGPGRPSPMVRARPEGGVALAIEISVDSVAVATFGLSGHLFDEARLARPGEQLSPEETVEDVVSLARPLLASLPSPAALLGIGAGVAGVVRRSDGFVHLAPNLGWKDIPLGAMLGRELGLGKPIAIANEADLGALAELRRGAGTGAHHLFYISGEVGVGIGIIHDGKPMLGASGYAGEAGHFLVRPGGHRCRCGATGCWETEAGEAALARLAGLPPPRTGLAVVETVLARAESGDDRAQAAIREVGRWLGIGIAGLVNVLNPELVVLGGIYHTLFAHLERPIVETMEASALAAPSGVARIVKSRLGAAAPLVGAAEMVIAPLIADPGRVRSQTTGVMAASGSGS